MKGIRLDHVNLPAEKILQVHLERAEVDQCGAGAKLYEEIDIATSMSLTAREGAEDLEATGTVTSTKSENLLSLRLEEGVVNEAFRGHGLILKLHDSPYQAAIHLTGDRRREGTLPYRGESSSFTVRGSVFGATSR